MCAGLSETPAGRFHAAIRPASYATAPEEPDPIRGRVVRILPLVAG
jgi:hypothetical protein